MLPGIEEDVLPDMDEEEEDGLEEDEEDASLPQHPVNSAALSASAAVKARNFFSNIQTPFHPAGRFG